MAPSIIFIHIPLFHNVWRFPFPRMSISACQPLSSNLHTSCLIRLETRFLACLFYFQPKTWVWKVSPGKDGDAKTLCDGKSPYLAKQMQALAHFFYTNLSEWKMSKFAARFCIKTVKKLRDQFSHRWIFSSITRCPTVSTWKCTNRWSTLLIKPIISRKISYKLNVVL